MILDQISQWERKLALRRSVVLFVTLWMTWRAFDWATAYAREVLAHSVNTEGALGAAAMITAVTAPIAYLQRAVFSSYIDSKPNGETAP